ncbi:hypothetical protein F4680DRAFT_469732 [Xylaria scruposa]|nr:hypothetical protein F4680DRAFT_469732 [Xylaria scruposa]
MRAIAAVMIASLAAAANGLSPSWSFASTTTIADEVTPWYTISASFPTTITTNVSGTVETITTTMVSISIGTKSPSVIPPVTPTSSPTILGTDSVYATAVVALVHGVHDVKARFASTSTGELITTTRPTTSIYYYTSGTSNAPSTSMLVSSIDSTTTFSTGVVTSSDTAYSTSTCDYDETSTSLLTISIPIFVTPTSWVTDLDSSCNESTTLTTRTLTVSPFTTNPATSTCQDGESGSDPSPFTHPTPTDNTLYNPTWQWGHHAEPTPPPVDGAESPCPHPTLPFEHPPVLRRAQWIAVLD